MIRTFLVSKEVTACRVTPAVSADLTDSEAGCETQGYALNSDLANALVLSSNPMALSALHKLSRSALCINR